MKDNNKNRLDELSQIFKDRGVVDMKFAWDYEKIKQDNDVDKLAEDVIHLLEAVLDGKYSPAPLNDSQGRVAPNEEVIKFELLNCS